MSALVDVRELVVRYGPAVALDGVSLTVGVGERVALVGANGAGKSSLLNAVCGVVRPAGGTVHVGGDDVTGRTPNQVVRRGLTQVPEGRQVFPEPGGRGEPACWARSAAPSGPRSSRRRFATYVGAARRANASSGSTPCCRSCTSCATAPQVERPAASSRWWQSDAHSWPSHARSRSTSYRSASHRSSSSSSSASCTG